MKDTKNKEDRGPLDLTYLIEQHRKDIWEFKEKEMEKINEKFVIGCQEKNLDQ